MPAEPPVVSPTTLAEAYALAADPSCRPLGGGTDLLVQIAGEIGEPPARVLDLWRIDELRGIDIRDGALGLGALTTYTEIRRSALCAEHAPALGEAAATIEEIKLLDGRYLNDRLQTYLIPTALDAPRIDTILVEARFVDAPHGAKGVGELPMDVGAPAVVAAIHDATGAWIHDLPATPERIMAALAGIDPPDPPGISTVSARSATRRHAVDPGRS